MSMSKSGISTIFGLQIRPSNDVRFLTLLLNMYVTDELTTKPNNILLICQFTFVRDILILVITRGTNREQLDSIAGDPRTEDYNLDVRS